MMTKIKHPDRGEWCPYMIHRDLKRGSVAEV